MPVDFVQKYFEAERHQMFAVVAGAAVFTAAAAGLFGRVRDSFSGAFFATVLVVSVASSGAALSLLRRDARAGADLSAAAASLRPGDGLDAERARVAVVVSKYDGYRYAVAALGLVALAGLVFTRKPWAHGVAAGLLLAVVAQVVVDHYSELRARRYHARLAEASTR